jgi:hypothetical protein
MVPMPYVRSIAYTNVSVFISVENVTSSKTCLPIAGYSCAPTPTEESSGPRTVTRFAQPLTRYQVTGNARGSVAHSGDLGSLVRGASSSSATRFVVQSTVGR